jgi:hypothetical protein
VTINASLISRNTNGLLETGSRLEAESDLGQAQQNADHAAGSKRCPHCRLCKTSTTNCSLGFLLEFHGRRQRGHFHNSELHRHLPCHGGVLLVKLLQMSCLRRYWKLMPPTKTISK